MKKILVTILLMLSAFLSQEMYAQKITKDVIDAEGIRTVVYVPSSAVCSRVINIQLKDNVIVEASYTGGCNGNTQGLSALLRGMKVDDAIAKLDGIDCNGRGTSCPDQLAKALKMIKASKPQKQE